MIRSARALPLGLLFLITLAGQPTEACAATIPYLVHISVDGLAGIRLQSLVATSPATYPNFLRLQQEGAFTYNARTDFSHSITIPAHASMISGRPVTQPAGQPNTVQHGYTNDFPPATDNLQANGNPNVPYKASTFDVVHDNGLSTAMFASKTRFGFYDRSWDVTRGALDVIGADNGRDKIDYTEMVDNTSAGIVNSFVTRMNAAPYNYTFLHLTEPDGAGHSSGWSSAAWATSVATVDSRLGQVFSLIDNNPLLNGNTAIILTADHGGGGDVPGGPLGGDRGHSTATSQVNYTIPYYVWGAGLPAGSDLYSALTNRFDPGAARLSYDAPLQPLWNGDSGNMALALLGLGTIPGSTLIANLQVPEPSSGALAVGAAMCAAVCRVRRRKSLSRVPKPTLC